MRTDDHRHPQADTRGTSASLLPDLELAKLTGLLQQFLCDIDLLLVGDAVRIANFK